MTSTTTDRVMSVVSRELDLDEGTLTDSSAAADVPGWTPSAIFECAWPSRASSEYESRWSERRSSSRSRRSSDTSPVRTNDRQDVSCPDALNAVGTVILLRLSQGPVGRSWIVDQRAAGSDPDRRHR